MHVRCPLCQDPIELDRENSLADVTCPSCGSAINLVASDDTVTQPPHEPETIAHFKLTERLGMGAFGTVWRAHDTQLDRQVAVKMPRKGQLDADEAEKFLREARTAAQLKHRNIVAVHEVGREGNTVYIVSDLIEGVTITDWLTGRRPTPREAAQLCEKIAHALHHAHQRGVIHRDLKPGNVMIDRQGEPHLMDFGLAKREAGEITMTYDGQVLGTPAYMSPEQARGENRWVDRRTDVYSLGVILFELLTGERPFRGNSPMLVHQLLTEEAPSPRKLNASVPRDLETICLKAIAKEPAARYDTAEALAQDLHRFLSGDSILARPVGSLTKAWRWCRRNRLAAGLTAGLILVLLVGLVSVSSLWLIAEDHRAQFEAERNEARREKQRADENFQQARQAVDEYFVKVSEDPVLKTQLLPLRKQLLEAALRYHQAFVQQRADDPQLQMELALSYLRVGQINAEIGSQEEAIRVYQQALALLRDRQRREGTNDTLLEHLAFCHYQMGLLLTALDRHDEARQAMQRNLEIRQQLAHSQPEDRARQIELADAYNGVAIAAARRYEPDPTALLDAVDVLKAMLQKRPDDHAVRHRLGGMLNSLATAHMMLGNLDAAEQRLGEAVAQQREAVKGDPSDASYQEFLGNQLFNQGQLYMQLQRVEQARAAYREAHQVLDRLVRANPALIERQVHLARTCLELSRVLDEAEGTKMLEVARDLLQRVASSNPARADRYLAEVYSKLALRQFDRGNRDEALNYWEQCRALLETEVERDPANRESHLRNLARCNLYLCQVYAAQNQSEPALQSGKQALKLYQELLAEAPDEFRLERRLAETCNELGLLHLGAPQLDEAERMLRRAVTLNDELMKREPEDSSLRVSAGGACCNLGNLFNERGEAEPALHWYQRADELLTGVLDQQSDSAAAQQYLANTLVSRMSILHQLDRYADELRDCQRAVQLASGELQETLKTKLAELETLAAKQAEADPSSD